MKDPGKKVKKFAVSQYPRPDVKMETGRLGYSDGEYMGYSLRTERYRYTLWLKDSFRSSKPYNSDLVVASELYDYQKDPDETINVADEKAYAAVRKDLNDKMVAFFAAQLKKFQDK